ncbi:hypothetical protein FRC03_009385 [Tulasnella sp. 419]|nr:hypothetical protein FRC03_009385 [Tulasnella sp. 419]
MMLDLWRMALDKVLLSLLKRYPYVFGAWKETLVANRELHPSMAESICQMFMRSPNLIFRQEGMRLYLLLREKIKNYKQSLWEKLEKLEGPTQQCILSLLDCKEADTGSNPAAGNLGVDEESFQKALCEALLLIHIQKVTPLRKQMMVQSLPEDVKISPVPALLECTHLDLLEHVDDFKLTPHYHEVSHAVIQEQPASSSVQEKYNFEDEMFNALPATSISKLPS